MCVKENLNPFFSHVMIASLRAWLNTIFKKTKQQKPKNTTILDLYSHSF